MVCYDNTRQVVTSYKDMADVSRSLTEALEAVAVLSTRILLVKTMNSLMIASENTQMMEVHS
jgi:hypothetical protein